MINWTIFTKALGNMTYSVHSQYQNVNEIFIPQQIDD